MKKKKWIKPEIKEVEMENDNNVLLACVKPITFMSQCNEKFS